MAVVCWLLMRIELFPFGPALLWSFEKRDLTSRHGDVLIISDRFLKSCILFVRPSASVSLSLPLVISVSLSLPYQDKYRVRSLRVRLQKTPRF